MEFAETTGLMGFAELTGPYALTTDYAGPLAVPYGIADACMLCGCCLAPTGRGCL